MGRVQNKSDETMVSGVMTHFLRMTEARLDVGRRSEVREINFMGGQGRNCGVG